MKTQQHTQAWLSLTNFSSRFLLAVLHLQTIRGQVSRSGVRKALSGLSSDLSEAYDKTFEAIKHQSQSRQQLALKALMWVSSARRPLNSLELRHALATRVEDTDLDVDNLPPLRLVVRSCCGLIAVDDLENDGSEVRLVHHTLYLYLHKRQRVWLANAHPMIAQICLSYLLFESLCVPADATYQSSKCREEEHHKRVEQKGQEELFVLNQFALDHWGYHASLCPPETYVEPAMRFLTDTERLKALYPGNNRITGLHIAAASGVKTLAHALITRGYRVDARDIREETPLHKACALNHTETAILLLKHGAKPDLWSLAMVTPLFIAVENGNKTLAKALLSNGAAIDMACKDHWTALHKAADVGDLDMVKFLVDHGSSTRNASARGLTALHRAAGRGHLSVMRFLLESGGGVQIEQVTRDGWTPLHGAASSGRTEAASWLLTYGADVHHCSWDGRTPLHRAVQGGYPDTVEMLILRGANVMQKDSNGDLPLHIAAREGHGEIIDRLLKKGLQQLSHLNENGWSPLQEAQLSGFHATEKRLRKHAHQSASNEGESILTKAIQTDDVSTIKHHLISNKVEIDSRDTQGRTLLHQAFLAESYNVASVLLSNGADVHAKFETGGWQAIHYAALSGNPQAVQLCLDHGADADSRTQHGQTPLHHACRNGNEETIQLLLDRGVNVAAQDDRGWQPLHHAAAAGHKGVVSMLVFSGRLNPAALMANWRSFQSCAANRGHHEVVEMIREFRYSLS